MNRIKHRQIIDDVLSARYDLIELAKAHQLSPEKLAEWIGQPAHQRVLTHLCVLADLQTQLLLSRHRRVAAARLIRLAIEEGEGDTARKACVDLLRLDLKRAAIETPQDNAHDDDLPTPTSLYGDT